MKRFRWIVFFCILPLSAVEIRTARAELKVGVAQVEMDFGPDVPLWGYIPRRKVEGKLDPLMARIFVFDSGETRIALVTLDLGRTFGPDELERVRKIARDRAGVDDVVFTASHTHSGPALEDAYPDGKTPPWQTAPLEAIGAGIADAASSMFTARLGAGHGRVEIGHNRRLIMPDGTVKMLWANPTRLTTHPVDPEVTILKIDDASGRTRGLLVGYACHPVVFGPDNALYSADFVGEMSRFVAAELPGDPVVAYIQGGCGDINPFMDKRLLKENAVAVRDRVGRKLGREVVATARRIETRTPASDSVELAIDTLRLNDRREAGKQYDADITVMLIAERYGFVGLPGEPFVQFQTDLKRRAHDLDAAFFMGYTNGYLRYFPTIHAAVQGGYGGNDWVAMTEVGAGERMMNRAYGHLYRMMGRLNDRPRR